MRLREISYRTAAAPAALVGARLGAVDVHVAGRGGEAGGDAVEVLGEEDLAA